MNPVGQFQSNLARCTDRISEWESSLYILCHALLKEDYFM